MNRFDWYVIHKVTKYVIAGFIDFNDAETFINALKHNEYTITKWVE